MKELQDDFFNEEYNFYHNGSGDNVAGNKTVNFNKSIDYKELTENIEELEELLAVTVDESKRLRYSERLNKKKEKLKTFKKDILKLADLFSKIDINSERLKIAKEYFDKGEFKKADAILDSEKMTEELDGIISNQIKAEKEIEELKIKREQIATEYQIKAQLWRTFTTKKNWIEKTEHYFKKSLKAKRKSGTLFLYASFLQDNNQLHNVESLYNEALQIKRKLVIQGYDTHAPHIALILGNLGNFHSLNNDFDLAKKNYQEALEIEEEFSNIDPEIHLPNMSHILNCIGTLYSFNKEYENSEEYHKKALNIRKELVHKNTEFLPALAQSLNNLGVLMFNTNKYNDSKQYYEEAIAIYNKLAPTDLTIKASLSDSLLNLANLFVITGCLENAESKFNEALKIRKDLSKYNPMLNLPNIANIFNSIGQMQSSKMKYSVAKSSFENAIKTLTPLMDNFPKRYSLDLALYHNNLANLHRNINEISLAKKNYNKALMLRREIARINPRNKYDVALTLNDYAVMLHKEKEYEEAIIKYKEAFELTRELTINESETYKPLLGIITAHLSLFYLNAQPNKEQSVSLALKAKEILFPLIHIPFYKIYFNLSEKVLNDNKESK